MQILSPGCIPDICGLDVWCYRTKAVRSTEGTTSQKMGSGHFKNCLEASSLGEILKGRLLIIKGSALWWWETNAWALIKGQLVPRLHQILGKPLRMGGYSGSGYSTCRQIPTDWATDDPLVPTRRASGSSESRTTEQEFWSLSTGLQAETTQTWQMCRI